MILKKCTIYLLFLITLISAETVFATVLENETIGAKAQPMGAAFCAIADDSSAVFFNPAGLSFNERNEWNGQLWAYYNKVKFKYETPTTMDKNTEYYLIPCFFIGKAYDRRAFGYGLYTPLGGGGYAFDRIEANIPGLQGANMEILMGVTFNHVAVSYKLMPNLSIGGGLFSCIGNYEEKIDGNRKEYDSYNAGYGGNIGILYKPVDNFSIGFAARSEILIKMDGNETINGIKYDSELEFTIPYVYDIGFAYKPIKDLTLSINFCRSLWSDMDKYEFEIEDTRQLSFYDSWRIGVGMHYQINQKLSFLAGIKDKRPSQNKEDGAIFPGSMEVNLFAYSAAISYQMTHTLEMNLGMTYSYGTDDYHSQKETAEHYTPSGGIRFKF